MYVIPLTYRPDVAALRYRPSVSPALSALLLVVVAWLMVIGAGLLVVRAILAEDLDGEQDESDGQISGHAPSE